MHVDNSRPPIWVSIDHSRSESLDHNYQKWTKYISASLGGPQEQLAVFNAVLRQGHDITDPPVRAVDQGTSGRTVGVHSCSANLPIAIVGAYYPVSIYSAIAANVATYALVGLVVEILRWQLNHSS
jgi:hypothetical protein